MDNIANTGERHFMKALTEPFHPQSIGARVPSQVPRETMAYNSFSSQQFVADANNNIMVLANFEQLTTPTMIVIKGNS
jgi:hypothetical protein